MDKLIIEDKIRLVFLYFSDWTNSTLVRSLDRRGFPHADKIIKVHAMRRDPREVLGRGSVTTMEVTGAPFFDKEEFPF